ncbi:MAG: tyrosine-type recombinase/integrase [Candidatus Obscuribacter sp.]|nr:tyrosine-type recombinase/integrase [Candidatus Obscuribacter sp.]
MKALETLIELEKGIDPNASDVEEKPKQPPTFEEALLLLLSERPVRENTRKQYLRDLKKNLGSYYRRPITDITDTQALRIYKEIEKRAPGVALKVSKIAHQVCSYAAVHPAYRDGAERLVPASPWQILSILKIKHKLPSRTDHLTEAEMPAFYNSLLECPCPSSRNLVLFILFTGCRLSEARGLRWDEVNLLKKRILLPAARVKTKTARELPITEEIEQLIQEQAATRLPIANYVFHSVTQVGPVPEHLFRDAFDAVRRRIERPDLTPHGLRRTFITECSKVEIMQEHELKLLVGHAKDVTGTYRQVGLEKLRAPAQRATTHLMKLLRPAEVDLPEAYRL